MKTYQPQLTGAIMFIEADDGEWVKRSDYDALAAELEAVKAERDTAGDMVDGLLAELARVKAESLRVVRLPDTTEHECPIATMGIIDDVIGFKDVDGDWYAIPDWKSYTPETFDKSFTPVELKPWESSNEAD